MLAGTCEISVSNDSLESLEPKSFPKKPSAKMGLTSKLINNSVVVCLVNTFIITRDNKCNEAKSSKDFHYNEINAKN